MITALAPTFKEIILVIFFEQFLEKEIQVLAKVKKNHCVILKKPSEISALLAESTSSRHRAGHYPNSRALLTPHLKHSLIRCNDSKDVYLTFSQSDFRKREERKKGASE